jgi:hypothetical protein
MIESEEVTMSVKYFLPFLLFIFILLLIFGCPYTSTFPLNSAEKAVIDDSLLGNWGNPDAGDDSSEVLHILPFNEHEYLILFFEKEETSIFRAFSALIGDAQFLSITEINPGAREDVNYIFARYGVSHDKLHINLVEEKLFENQEFGDSKELNQFLNSHSNNEMLYDDTQTLIRVNYSKLIR